MKCSYPNIKLLQLDCYLSAASRTWIENLLPLPKRDGLGGQHHHRCDYFLKPSGSIILRCFWDIQYNDDYFMIITIISPTINRSDASPKSTAVRLTWFFGLLIAKGGYFGAPHGTKWDQFCPPHWRRYTFWTRLSWFLFSSRAFWNSVMVFDS